MNGPRLDRYGLGSARDVLEVSTFTGDPDVTSLSPMGQPARKVKNLGSAADLVFITDTGEQRTVTLAQGVLEDIIIRQIITTGTTVTSIRLYW